jgi:hypothetical protein
VPVPSWATFIGISYALYNVLFTAGGSGATCSFYPVIGSNPAAPTVTSPAALANVPSGPANASRMSFAGNCLVAIPPGIRATTQTLQMAAFGAATGGTLTMDVNSAITVDYEFFGYASLT